MKPPEEKIEFGWNIHSINVAHCRNLVYVPERREQKMKERGEDLLTNDKVTTPWNI